MSKIANTNSQSTEEKIKEAARKVFMRKGFSATRTRDIAEEAGINLALLNYYFRSKKKLFDEIMQEKFKKLFGVIIPILNDNATSLETKIELVVSGYIEVLLKNPDLPIFVLNEIRKENTTIVQNISFDKVIFQSSFMNQLKEKRNDLNPAHFLISILGMTIFPFVAKPMMLFSGLTNEDAFTVLMNERKELIPIWTKAMLESNVQNI
ncbi:TetR/AcrR family transcriptional regulator [Flavobacterium sp.]|uniref:TetR/AcrR family transcriptional regulator n=1 Tax=Flavobacterium sp. TaxID=239 RepID=UPI002CA65C23|nr:TetR/AcrR family transcriptional regulator [Flavobacterium sp.]HSD07730.1 TetR/AcrR family transcriptional regulator [Flavobacterium sp.]